MKRALSLLMSFMLSFNMSACGFVGTVKEAAVTAKDKVVEWYSNIDLSVFERGWDHAVEFAGSTYASAMGSEYVRQVGNEINKFKMNMNSAYGSARGIAQEAGYAAEKWVANTFNIDSVVRGSSEHADVVDSNALGSVDVKTSYGENASLKYYNSASGSASAQAVTIINAYRDYYNSAKGNSSKTPMSLKEYLDNHGYDAETQDELLASIYEGQTRIIPTDQIDEAKAFLQARIDKLSTIDGDVASARNKSYSETLYNLRDRLKAPDGTQSTPATYEEMQAVAELSKNGDFSPEDFGFTTSQLITPKYIVKQAVGVGAKTAVLNLVLEIGPDIYSIVSETIKARKFSDEDLRETGVDGVITASEGFIEGSVSCALATACKAGKLGTSLINSSPEIIGALTVLTVDAIRYGYEFSKGTITAEAYGNLIAEEIIVSAVSLSVGSLVALLFGGATVAYMAGCLAGGMMASVGYDLAREVILEVKDGGGFEAIVPTSVLDSISVAKDAVSRLNILDRISNFKDLVVSTASDGYIKIKSAVPNSGI